MMIFMVLGSLTGIFVYHDHVHFHIARVYAWAGYDVAQHKVGQHYLVGEYLDSLSVSLIRLLH